MLNKCPFCPLANPVQKLETEDHYQCTKCKTVFRVHGKPDEHGVMLQRYYPETLSYGALQFIPSNPRSYAEGITKMDEQVSESRVRDILGDF